MQANRKERRTHTHARTQREGEINATQLHSAAASNILRYLPAAKPNKHGSRLCVCVCVCKRVAEKWIGART